MGRRWIRRTHAEIPASFETLPYPTEIKRILVARGLKTAEDVEAFLDAGLHRLSDPFQLSGMRAAVDRIVCALECNEPICVFGDYDVDGQTSTALMLRILREFGADVRAYIPNRQNEGYGLNIRALQALKDQGCRLVVSVDCGISASAEAEWAAANGLDLVITDHHEPPSVLPEALAVVNPKLDHEPGLSELAGCGVAFKLAEALGEALGRGRSPAHQYVDLVALGTVADVVPLMRENRALVRAGLDRINSKQTLPGIRALCDVAGVKGPVRAGHIGFSLAPRLNAVGRIGDAAGGLALLMASSYDEAVPMAELLDEENARRQSIEATVVDEARHMIEERRLFEERGVVVCGEGWHIGVVGIAASRLVEMYYRPTVILTVEEGRARGSGRSIPGFDLYSALEACSDLFEAFGGHTQAAGVTLPIQNVERFMSRFHEVTRERLSEEDLIPHLEIDGEVGVETITLDWIERLALLEPYGMGNPTPVFTCRDVKVDATAVGKRQEHLKCNVHRMGTREAGVDGIGFGMAEALMPRLPEAQLCDVAFTPEVNEWNGRRRPSLRLRDIRQSVIEARPQVALLAASHAVCAQEEGRLTGVSPAWWSGERRRPVIVDRRGDEKVDLLTSLVSAGTNVLLQTSQPGVWSLANRLAEASPTLKGAIFAWHERLLETHRDEFERALSMPPWIAVASSPFLWTHPAPRQSFAPKIEGGEGAKLALVLWEPPLDPRALLAQLDALTSLGCEPPLYIAYTSEDVRRLETWLATDLPSREQLRHVYKALQEASEQHADGRIPERGLVEVVTRKWPGLLSERGILRALAIFTELRLLAREGGQVEMKAIKGAKVDLAWSVLYNECNLVRTDVWGDPATVAALPGERFFERMVAGAKLIDHRIHEMNVS